MKDSIMQNIKSRKRKIDYIFGWTDIIWLRKTLALASLIIVLAFIIQQLFVVDRINKLEKRMISINTEKILEYQRENVIVNSVIMEQPETSLLADSIKVSTDDLLNLLREYKELQYRYEKILGSQIKKDSNKQKL
jgi:hypothetical protein